MPAEQHLTDLTRTIQLAVAPVFLLTALGTLLSVLSGRLGRVVDRARVLATRIDQTPVRGLTPREELALLGTRRKLVNNAIAAATCSALLVCLLIALAFLGFMLKRDVSLAVAGLFIAAMTAFIAALLFFLREILLTARAFAFDLAPPVAPNDDGEAQG